MAAKWYALQSKPNKESLLWEQLSSYHIETFYPQIRVRVTNPRARKLRPYFTGYLFVHVDLNVFSASNLKWMPGARNLVSFGGEPAHVPEGLIQAIRRRVDEINQLGGELLDDLSRGEAVWIERGPFAGYKAIFDARLSGSERVRVLLKLLSKGQVPLELPARQIRRIKRR